MEKPRIILADTNRDYIFKIQLKFVEEYFEKIDIEIITDKDYFEQSFSTQQNAAILVVSEDLYNMESQKHNIKKIFLLAENNEDEGTEDLKIEKVYKYSNPQEIFNEIVGKSGAILNVENLRKKEPQIITVTSAAGGTGKTTIAMGLAASLSQNYKRVLYINCGSLQCFGHLLKNGTVISDKEITKADTQVFSILKHLIRHETFKYLPPFKASLLSLDIAPDMFLQIAKEAKQSGEYDFIIVDTDSDFDSYKAAILTQSDRVIIVTKQSKSSVIATNTLAENINGVSGEKFVFVCNDYNEEVENALETMKNELKFGISEIIEHFKNYDDFKGENFAEQESIKRVAILFE